MKLGKKSMEEHVHNFMELLRYMDYIRESKWKHIVMSGEKGRLRCNYCGREY